MKSSEVILGARGVVAAVVAGLLCAGAASAAETVEDQTAVMDAQLGLLKKQGELEAARRALAGSTLQAMPTVVSAMTIGSRRIARLQLATGQVSSFQEGDTVSPGVVLGSVQPRRVSVLIQNGGKFTEIPLAFALPPAAQIQPPPGSATASIPEVMLPPLPRVPLPPGFPMPVGPAHEAKPAAPALAAKAPAQPPAQHEAAPSAAPAALTHPGPALASLQPAARAK